MRGIQDSIEFSQLQVGEEESKLGEIQERLDDIKYQAEEKRQLFDVKKAAVETARNTYQQIQRNLFDAEKKVAVADTSIQNLQRAGAQLTDEKQNREAQIQQLERELGEKEALLESKRSDLQQLQQQHERTKEQILETLVASVKPGDVVVFMSNGMFEGLPRRLVGALSAV